MFAAQSVWLLPAMPASAYIATQEAAPVSRCVRLARVVLAGRAVITAAIPAAGTAIVAQVTAVMASAAIQAKLVSITRAVQVLRCVALSAAPRAKSAKTGSASARITKFYAMALAVNLVHAALTGRAVTRSVLTGTAVLSRRCAAHSLMWSVATACATPALTSVCNRCMALRHAHIHR